MCNIREYRWLFVGGELVFFQFDTFLALLFVLTQKVTKSRAAGAVKTVQMLPPTSPTRTPLDGQPKRMVLYYRLLEIPLRQSP